MKNKPKKIVIIILAVLLVIGIGLAISNQIFNFGGIKKCPDEMIVDHMPIVDRSGESESDIAPARSSYYVLNSERKEIDDFDLAWVGANCSVPVTAVE